MRERLPRPIALAAVALAGALAGCGPFGDDDGDDEPRAPAPPVSAERTEADPPEAAEELGFPAFATANTTRVAGGNAAATAAGAALAAFPSAGDSPSPQAVTLVAEDEWRAGIAAAALVAEPIGAPILVGSPDGVPSITETALEALDPRGGPRTDRFAAFAVGDVEVPAGLRARRFDAGGPAEQAARIERLRSRLTGGDPSHVVVAPQDSPGFAMPAAAWAARSGDPVLFARRRALPAATREALERLRGVPVYVLGPPSAISDRVVREIARVSARVRRVSGVDPVANAIELARYADGSFGWNMNDPGHGFVVARSDRPLDAAAAAPLSASGAWGPLLLTDNPDTLPGPLRGYLLDLKPGYETDPTRAVYNHVWVIGDQEAIDVSQQADIDELAALTRIGAGAFGEPEPGGGRSGGRGDGDERG